MSKRDNIDSTIDHWLSSHPISNPNSKSGSNKRKPKKSSRNFNIEFNLEPSMGLDDLPVKETEIIEKATPHYRWSSFADADSSGMDIDDGNSGDLRGFAGQLTPTSLSLTPSARLPTGNFSSLHVDDLLWDSASPSSSDRSTISFSGAGLSMSKGNISSIPINPEEISFRGKGHLVESDGEAEGPDGVWFASLAKNRGEREGNNDSDHSMQLDQNPSSPSSIPKHQPDLSSSPSDSVRRGEKQKKERKTRYSDSTKTIHQDAPKSTHRVRNMVSEPQLSGGLKLSGDDNYAAFEGLLQQMGMVGGNGSSSQQQGQNQSSNFGGNGNGNGNGHGGVATASSSSSSHQAPINHYVDHSRSYTAPNSTPSLEMNASNLYQRRSSRDHQDQSSHPSSGYPSASASSESYNTRGRRHPGLASAPGGQRNMTLRPSNEPASAGHSSVSFAQQQQELFGRSRAATMTSGMPLGLGGLTNVDVGLDPNSPRYGALALTASNTSQQLSLSSIDPFGSPNTSSISRARSLANFHALHAAQQVARLGEKPDFVLPSHQFRDDVNNQRAAGAVRAALLYGMEQSNGSPLGRRKSVTTDPGGIDRIDFQLETPDTPNHPLPQGFDRARNESFSSQSSNSSLRYGNMWPQHVYSSSAGDQSGSLGRNSLTTNNTSSPPSSAEFRGGSLPDSHHEEMKKLSVSSSASQSFDRNDGLMLNVSQPQMNFGGYGQPASFQNEAYPSSGFREFVGGAGNSEAWGRIPSWSSESAPNHPNQQYSSTTGAGNQLGAAYQFPSSNPRTQVYGEAYQPSFSSPSIGAGSGNGNGNARQDATMREASPQKMRSSPELRIGSESTSASGDATAVATSRPIAARGRASSNASRASKSKSTGSNEQSRASRTPPIPPERISSLRKRKSDALISSNPRKSSNDNSTGGNNIERDTTPSGMTPTHGRTASSSSSSISSVASRSIRGNSKPPHTPGNPSSGSSHARQPSSTGVTTFSFVNFGLDDADELCAAVTPSGSYKTPLKNRDQILKNRGKKFKGEDDDDDDEDDEIDEMEEDDEDEEEGATPTNKPSSKRANKKRRSGTNLKKSAGSASTSGRRSRTTSNK